MRRRRVASVPLTGPGPQFVLDDWLPKVPSDVEPQHRQTAAYMLYRRARREAGHNVLEDLRAEVARRRAEQSRTPEPREASK